MIEGQPHITALIQGYQPTMNQAGAGAEGTGRAMAKGQPFNCVRGQGRLTLEECLTRFLNDHPVCFRDCGCSLGKRAVEKMNNGEIEMPKKFKKGDCSCGRKDVQLDSEGLCYVCREEARRRTRMTPAASEDITPPVAPGEAVPSIQAAQEGHLVFDPHAKIDFPNGEAAKDWLAQKVGPRVEEAGEKLKTTAEGLRPLANIFAALTLPDGIPPEGQLVGDEDPLPDACQGWPETAGRLVVEGFDFVAIPSGKNAKIHNAVVSFRSSAVAFSADAVRKHGLNKFKYLRMHKAPGAVGFELLTEPGPNTRTMCRQAKDTAALSCTIHRLKEIFPGLSGRRFDLEATARPGFYLARVGR
jgi:hypothetical protein